MFVDKTKLNFPLRINVRMKWSDEGLKHWRSGHRPNQKPPAFKTIEVSEAEFDRYMITEPGAMQMAIVKQKKA